MLEFDEKKRSCRRRLSDHNARRRKPRQETIQFHSGKLSSSCYGTPLSENFDLIGLFHIFAMAVQIISTNIEMKKNTRIYVGPFLLK